MNTVETEYQLNEIEADIRPEDFRDTSFWKRFVATFGPAPLVMLAKEYGGDRVSVPTPTGIVDKPMKRDYLKKHVPR